MPLKLRHNAHILHILVLAGALLGASLAIAAEEFEGLEPDPVYIPEREEGS
jgi:hypothetical protein